MRLRHKGWWLLAIAALYLLPPLWAIQQDAYGIPVTGMLHRMPLLRLPEFLAGILLCGLFREWRAAGGQLGIAARLALGAFVLASFLTTVWLLRANATGISCCTTACCCRRNWRWSGSAR